ncbi:MAG: Gfo/Idh/MocA family oxidoreductase [Chloroflexi bacterium]|nr:Gfo/Idh/MocA family oxidoreductase [Chloroflexota bacterium]
MVAARRLRFAVIGVGDFGPQLLQYINEVADVAAICDPSPASRSRCREQTGLNLAEFEEHETLLDRVPLDAVAIASPNFTHKEITIAAARRGRHVFCEKAMAVNVPDCWEMVRACEKAGVRLMVGHKRRLRPPWARMIELRAELGEVLAISSVAYWDIRPPRYNYPAWWNAEARTGGTLTVADVHITDWMRAMCGDVARVSAVAAPQMDPKYDYPDTMHVTYHFHSGAVADLNVALNYPLLQFRQSGGPLVVCRNGAMRFVPDMDHIDLYWQRLSEREAHHERFDDLGFDAAFRREVGDFVRWITDGSTPCLTWREGLRCVEAMEAAHRSARQGGAWLSLPLYPELEPVRGDQNGSKT